MEVTFWCKSFHEDNIVPPYPIIERIINRIMMLSFLDFKVDFKAKELISTDFISQYIDTFSDINDLKYEIEELIEKQC